MNVSNVSDISCIFLRKQDENGTVYGFVPETDSHRPYYGKFVPSHKKLMDGELPIEAAYRALLDEVGVEGIILPNQLYRSVEGTQFHYFVAEFERQLDEGEKELTWFAQEQILAYNNNNIAEWVPGIMQEMRLI